MATLAEAPADDLSSAKGGDAVHCESLRISYLDPTPNSTERFTEDVFLDPRDSWCAAGGILFVTAKALTAIQKQLDSHYKYFKDSSDTIDRCRHDYLKELQYLLEELQRMRKENPRNVDAIDDLLDRVQDQRDLASVGELDPSEVSVLLDYIGPRDESDEELIHHMEMAGISRGCELTLRILLKLMREGASDLVAEKARLLKILGPVEAQSDGPAQSVVDALLAAASAEGATILDLILVIQDHFTTDEGRQGVEDLVTEKLRDRYAKLQEKYEDLVPKIEGWYKTLAVSEEREARLFYLREEAAQLQAEVTAREELEAAKIAAWEAKNDPAKKAELIEMKAADTSNMSSDDQDKLRSMQLAEKACMDDCMKMSEEMRKCENELEEYHAKKDELEALFPDLEASFASAQQDEESAVQRLQRAEEREKVLRQEEASAEKLRTVLEDEYAASLIPPPKTTDFAKIEEQIEKQKARNAEFKEMEDEVYARERKYEDLCAKAEHAWQEEEAAARAEADAERLAEESTRKSTPAKRSRQLAGDPMDMRYYQRCKIPEVATQPRHVNLHTDMRARDRQLRTLQNDHSSVETEKLLAAAEAVGVFGAAASAPKQAKAHVPVLFRRPEDLRVRLAGSQITVGHVDGVLAEHRAQTAELSEHLQSIRSRMQSYASESLRLHGQARSCLASIPSGGGYPDNTLSSDLSKALQEHQSALEKAEQVWQQAEQFSERNFSEADVHKTELSCSVFERELTAATRLLYTTASQAAEDASAPLADPAKQCVSALQAGEPQLAAAGAARKALWPQAAEVSERLRWERQVQDGLESFLRNESTRRDLLSGEVQHPDGEARRALASMRAAISAGLPSASAVQSQVAPSAEQVTSTKNSRGTASRT